MNESQTIPVGGSAEKAAPAVPVSAPVPGSVGMVETQYLDLPNPVQLDCGEVLHPIRVAYETYGELSPDRDNVILVCHALSGDAHAAGFSNKVAGTRDGFRAEDRDGAAGKALGWWDGMIGPGKAFDTDRYFVVSTNLLGGCRGTTGPSSLDPATGRPYGSSFPVITVAGLQFGSVIAFAIITETVFQWPGMGLLFVQAVQNVDIPIMAAYLLMVSLIFVTINLVVELLYTIVDPRLRSTIPGRTASIA